jgi:predicted DNA-binding transcriptional regulator AlpA
MKYQNNPQPRYLREKDLLKVIPISKSTLWRKVARGAFPKPIKLSEKITVWRTEDIEDWFNEQEIGS